MTDRAQPCDDPMDNWCGSPDCINYTPKRRDLFPVPCDCQPARPPEQEQVFCHDDECALQHEREHLYCMPKPTPPSRALLPCDEADVWDDAASFVRNMAPCRCRSDESCDECDIYLLISAELWKKYDEVRRATPPAAPGLQARIESLVRQSEQMATNDFYRGLHQGHLNALEVARATPPAEGRDAYLMALATALRNVTGQAQIAPLHHSPKEVQEWWLEKAREVSSQLPAQPREHELDRETVLRAKSAADQWVASYAPLDPLKERECWATRFLAALAEARK